MVAKKYRGGYTAPGLKNHNDVVSIATTIGKQPFFWFSWKAIFRRALLQSNSIGFISRILGEDTIFNLASMLRCNLLYYLNEPLYHYTRNPGSVMHKHYKENYLEMLNANYRWKNEIYNTHGIKNYQRALADYALNHSTLMLIGNEMRDSCGILVKTGKYREIRKSDMVTDAFKFGKISAPNIKQTVLLYLLKFRLYLALAIIGKLA